MSKKKSHDYWTDNLTYAAKAEILAGVLHSVEEDKIFKKFTKRHQKTIKDALRDCGVWHKDLSKQDLKQIGEWFSTQFAGIRSQSYADAKSSGRFETR